MKAPYMYTVWHICKLIAKHKRYKHNTTQHTFDTVDDRIVRCIDSRALNLHDFDSPTNARQPAEILN